MNSLFAILNKAIIISLAPFLVTSATLEAETKGTSYQVGQTVLADKKIKQLELGANTMGIVLDNQAQSGTDEFLTSGSDMSSFTYASTPYTGKGMLGQGVTSDDQFNATAVDLDQDGTMDTNGYIKEIEMGQYFSGAITHEYAEGDTVGQDKLYMWGNDIGGYTIPESDTDLESLATQSYSTPILIDIDGDGVAGTTNSISSLNIGVDHASVLVTTDEAVNPNHLYTWGMNDKGQAAGMLNSATPKEIDMNYFMQDESSEITFEEIELGDKVSFAVVHDSFDDEDHLYGWGSNTDKRLGLPLGVSSNKIIKPTEVELSTVYDDLEILDVESGLNATFASTKSADGEYHLFTWGTNINSVMGTSITGMPPNSGWDYEPIEINYSRDDSNSIIKDVEINPLGENVYVVTENQDDKRDHVYTWGDNSKQQFDFWELGAAGELIDEVAIAFDLDVDGDGIDGAANNITQISAGTDTVALVTETENGEQQEVYMWGDNSHGEFGWGVNESDDSITSTKMAPQLVYQTNVQNAVGDSINDTDQWLKILLIALTIVLIVLLILAIVL